MNDVDIETAELHAYAGQLADARKAGVCIHERFSGFTGPIECLDCGRKFNDLEAWHEARLCAVELGE